MITTLINGTQLKLAHTQKEAVLHSAENWYPIVCDELTALCIKEEAEKMGVKIPEPVTYQQTNGIILL